MNVQISEKQFKQIEKIVEKMDNISIEDFIAHALANEIKPYMNDEYEIGFTNAKLESENKECYVIGTCTMFGNDYYRILYDNQIMKVPKKQITLLGGGQ